MEDKIKEGYYALCLAILKGYVTETAKECGCSVSTVKRYKRMKLEQQSLWDVFGNDLKNKTY